MAFGAAGQGQRLSTHGARGVKLLGSEAISVTSSTTCLHRLVIANDLGIELAAGERGDRFANITGVLCCASPR